VRWAIEEKGYTQRRACRLVGLEPKTYRYATKRPDDGALRQRLKELASERRRFGYRRLHLLLRREGVVLNRKRLYRLYREEKLTVRKRGGRKRALGTRAPMAIPQGRNQRWSLGFVSDTLASGRKFRMLTVVDDFSRESLAVVVDSSLSGIRVARELDQVLEMRGTPCMVVSRQWHRVHVTRHPGLAGRKGRGMALHRSRQADPERLHRELQWPAARRVPQRAPLRQPARGQKDHRRMEDRL
jgi:putative transposase